MRSGFVLSAARAYWLNTVASQLRNLDVAVVGMVAPAVQAGYYSIASRLTAPLRLIPTSLAAVVLPVASNRSVGGLARLGKMCSVAVAGMVLGYGLLALAMPAAVPALLGHSYLGSVGALQIVCISLPFAGAASLFGALLQGVGLKRFVALTSSSTGVLALLLVGIGAMRGPESAAVGLGISFGVQAVVLGAGVLRTKHLREGD